METTDLISRAQDLVQQLAEGCESNDFGSTTISIYNTAWVSMITKRINGQDQWLFPESFQYILDTQLPDGSWDSHTSLEDGILNTMAALLALKKHTSTLSATNGTASLDINDMITKAKKSLNSKLHRWDVETGVNVRFEILVPAILAMLETEGVYFQFPAFIGVIDFDRLCQHKTLGGMMGSPASTAAYLIHSSLWDAEAEAYLARVVLKGQGEGSGGVPTVFPTPLFEITWVVSTLFQANFSVESMKPPHLSRVASYLENRFDEQGGLLGFAPGLVPDADDTAKAILALHHVGKSADPAHMISHFRSKHNHFCTYPGERDASFSANCNVLQALLCSVDVKMHATQITGVAIFLCESWWADTARDKWNVSSHYSMMLLAEALVRLLQFCDQGILQLSTTLLQEQLPIVLIQIVNRTLLTQADTGNWDLHKTPEVTAYGVLTLRALLSLPWIVPIRKQMDSSIQAGQRHLLQAKERWDTPQQLWIGKTKYGSGRLSEAYCLAAMTPPKSSYVWSKQISNLVQISEKLFSKMFQMISHIDSYFDQPIWKLNASIIEGGAFLALLKSAKEFLPRQRGAKDEYLDFIPCTWVLVNNYKTLFMPPDFLWDLMVLSICNFRADEYMETTVARVSDDKLQQIKVAISGLCSLHKTDSNRSKERPYEDSTSALRAGNGAVETDDIVDIWDAMSPEAVLGGYIGGMMGYPRIQRASLADKDYMCSELLVYLHSHITQTEDNGRFSIQEPLSNPGVAIFASPRTSYHTWLHTIGASSVSCPFSFAFLCCLLGAARPSRTDPTDCFPHVFEKYLARDLCAHLAVMSRLYNDYGSLERDRLEANINSVNFPEFHSVYDLHRDTNSEEVHEGKKKNQVKADLLALAQYERGRAECVGNKLSSSLRTSGLYNNRRKADSVELFFGVATLYADFCVVKDLSNHVDKDR